MRSTSALSPSPAGFAHPHTSEGPGGAHRACPAEEGSATLSACDVGSASTKAMSSFDQVPQAEIAATAATTQDVLVTERILDPEEQLGVAEAHVAVHVV